jgi:hypothetical protein
MTGLVPAFHAFMSAADKDVDGRTKPAHDEVEGARCTLQPCVSASEI